jgi:hypothetical protein
VNTNLYVYKNNPSFINKKDQRKKKTKDVDIEQIYGHGSQRGPMPGVSVPAGCRQYASASASASAPEVVD